MIRRPATSESDYYRIGPVRRVLVELYRRWAVWLSPELGPTTLDRTARSLSSVRRAPVAIAAAEPRKAASAEGVGSTVAEMSRLDLITTDPSICHGKPTVRGLRYPVEILLEMLASGMTLDEILEDYPDLERDDLLAALEFGALTAGTRVMPLGAP